MTLLSRFLKLLEWLESVQDFVHFLTQPTGFSAAIAICLYCPIHLLGCDSFSATMLSSTAALTLYCLLERPDF